MIERNCDTTGDAENLLISGQAAALWLQFRCKFGLREARSDDHTYFRVSELPGVAMSSRLDRVFVPASEAYSAMIHAELGPFRVGVAFATAASQGVSGHASTRPGPLATGISDHIPIRLRCLQAARPSAKPNVVQRWICDAPTFVTNFLSIWRSSNSRRSSYKSLNDFKTTVRAAAVLTRKDLQAKGTSRRLCISFVSSRLSLRT
jgi:hypothetical protein